MHRMELDPRQPSDPMEAIQPSPAPEEPIQPTPSAEPAAQAVARRKRGPRPNHITIDEATFLTAGQLRSMSDDYLENMGAAWRDKKQRRAKLDAKKNAEIWLLEHGIPGVLTNPQLKDLFCGRALLTISANERPEMPVKTKRKAPDDEEEADERRVRARTASEEVGRALGDGGGFGPDLGLGDEEMEVGRDRLTPLPGDDIQSLNSDLPWARSGGFLSPGLGASSSVRSAGGSIRGRMSDSPLKGRGVRDASIAGSVMLDIVEEVDESNLVENVGEPVDQFEFWGAGE